MSMMMSLPGGIMVSMETVLEMKQAGIKVRSPDFQEKYHDRKRNKILSEKGNKSKSEHQSDDTQEESNTTEGEADDMESIKQKYFDLFGKAPHHKLTKETIMSKIADKIADQQEEVVATEEV